MRRKNITLTGAISLILVVVLLAGGLGLVTKGFANWNPKEWFAKTDDKTDDTTGEIEQPVSFKVDSWETIAAVSESGEAKDFYKVGDEKTIMLSTNEVITLIILGFDHDNLSDGSGKAGMTIGMRDLLIAKYPMTINGKSDGGWETCYVRKQIMPMLFTQLPESLQASIKTVNKKSTYGYDGEQIKEDLVTSKDKLFLYSLTEFNKEGKASYPGYFDDSKLYEYWETRQTDADAIRKSVNGTGSTSIWWTRGASNSTLNSWLVVSTTGRFSANPASNSNGLYFNFCI